MVTGLTGQGVVTGLTPVVVGAGIISMGGGAVGESQQGSHGDGARSGVRAFSCEAQARAREKERDKDEQGQ